MKYSIKVNEVRAKEGSNIKGIKLYLRMYNKY